MPLPPCPPFLTVKRFSNFGRESEAFDNFEREYKSDLRNIEWKLDGIEIECKGGAELCKRREAIRAQWLREWLIYAQKPLDMVDKIFERLIPNLAILAPTLTWGKANIGEGTSKKMPELGLAQYFGMLVDL